MSCDRSFTKVDRRGFLGHMSTGLAGVALANLMAREGVSAKVARPTTHFEPKAKRVLQIFCPGGVSHMDTFEYKPELDKHHGEPLPGLSGSDTFMGGNGNLMKCPWRFSPAGECGKWINQELFPHLSKLVDDIAFIHSLQSKTNTHGPGCTYMNSSFVTEGFPSAGAWVSYALGSENEDLPTYICLPDIRGIPPAGPANWSSGFLPARHQAVVFNTSGTIENLERPSSISAAADRDARKYLALLNRMHGRRFPGNSVLGARVASYELAARMQLSAPEVSDFDSETSATHAMYGTTSSNKLKSAYARNCLLARRMLERGVRYVSLYCASRASGVDGLLNWDAHKTLKSDYERHAPVFDQPTAALINDLRMRGLLDDTLVLWNTEFGRFPTHQEGTVGRDHNPNAMTAWMLGAGVKGGVSYGATDDVGHNAVEKVCTVYDFYATVLHLLGLDHERVTYYHNGIERRLTDVHGYVIDDVLA